MAFDAFMFFQDYSSNYLKAESQVVFNGQDNSEIAKLFTTAGAGNVFEIDDFSFDIEQTLNISSQSSGVGAGKVTFNPFKITRKTDVSSPAFFLNTCQGKAFQQAVLGFRKASGTGASGLFYMAFIFKLVAVHTMAWSGADGDESPKEEISFQYGALQVKYAQQNSDGSLKAAVTQGWNQMTNIADTTAQPIIAR